MQPIQQDQSEPNDLQQSLDAYYDKRLAFDQLRTQWIIALAENPQMCSDAVRLLYQQSPSPQLTEDHTLSLKRIIEAAEHDGPEDWTVVFENEQDASADGESLPAVKLLPGHILKNRFVLEEKLGSGGVGIVFRAHDRLLQRAAAGPAKIALKVLREEFRTNPEQLDALQREAGHAQGLSHPNIVRVYDLHEDRGTYFLTMELLKGELLRTLLARLARAPLSRERTLRIITGMCRGLAHAHEHGLVHADFKPGNVILTAGDEPKILDFGLAQVAAPFGKTRNGSAPDSSKSPRAVTPAYASCNRLEGGPPSFSDDVYSLSCVIYELLSGRHPYDRKSALVARAMNLRPSRIEHLTDLQWRTLATGLKPSREHRSTQVHDLQVAFSPLVALRPAATKVKSAQAGSLPPVPRRPRKASPEQDVDGATAEKAATSSIASPGNRTGPTIKRRTRRRRGRNTVAPIVTGLLLGTLVMVGMFSLLDKLEVSPSEYVDKVRDSRLLQSLRSSIGLDDEASSVSDAGTPQQPGAAEATAAGEPGSAPQTRPTAEQDEPAPLDKKNNAAVVEPPAAAVLSDGNAVDQSPEMTPESETSDPVEALATDSDPAPGAAAVAAGFRLDSAEYVAREGAAALAFQIVRQGDLSAAARIEWTTYEDTAESRRDYVGAFRNVETFAAGESARTIFIPIVSDNIAERNEYFRLALSRPGGSFILAEPFTATVTIIDDDF